MDSSSTQHFGETTESNPSLRSNSLNRHNWMSRLPDSTSISALSIPGTHNSATFYRALPSVRCQAVSVIEQLQNGIRFLDIRLQPSLKPSNTALTIVHGAFPISFTGRKTFHSLLKDITTFLDSNPGEAIIISLKREGTGNTSDEQLAQTLHDHYTTSSYWFTEPRIPALHEVRGKIILLRRFALPHALSALHSDRGWGLNAQEWTYNSPDCWHGDVRVQDSCEVLRVSNIEEKIKFCSAHFERASQASVAAAGGATAGTTAIISTADAASVSEKHELSLNLQSSRPLYLNFLSGSYFWRRACWPERIAARTNPAALAFLREKFPSSSVAPAEPTVVAEMLEQASFTLQSNENGKGSVGIVVCDWIGLKGDWDLVDCIIGLNRHLQCIK